MKLAGIILIIIGVVALIYQGFTYSAPHTDAQIGSLVIKHDETHSVWVPPVVGAVFIVGGIAAVALGAKK